MGGRLRGEAYRLAWSDEFDGAPGAPADRKAWQAETGGSGWGNQELQYYTDEPGNAALDGAGNLAIVVRRVDPGLGRRPYGGRGYTSARLISRDRVPVRYGLIQARIKIPRARGIWPAFWMLGQDIGQSGWPGCGEIDVMEHFGTGPATVHGTVHGPGYAGRGGISASCAVGPSLGRDFHVYSVAWEPGQILWYVNDDLYHAVTPADLDGKPWVFDHEFFLLINVAVGGTASVPPDESVIFPQTMLIDYIRLYELA
ncbi:MAG TPA: glycoside hydrolase family 16 protein [Streptosporangiaceae bacterium]|nr:glycoside hydrolase family 16 protein [Streptosporangiaceae bacterium]